MLLRSVYVLLPKTPKPHIEVKINVNQLQTTLALNSVPSSLVL